MSRCILQRVPDPRIPPPVSAATRRELFGTTMGALMLLSAVKAGQAKAAELDGELIACCAEADRLDAKADALTDEMPPDMPLAPCRHEADRLGDEAYSLRERVAQLRARTPEGLQAKARLVLARLESDSLASELALSLARDVLGRAGA